jgi:hypothetical protein
MKKDGRVSTKKKAPSRGEANREGCWIDFIINNNLLLILKKYQGSADPNVKATALPRGRITATFPSADPVGIIASGAAVWRRALGAFCCNSPNAEMFVGVWVLGRTDSRLLYQSTSLRFPQQLTC